MGQDADRLGRSGRGTEQSDTPPERLLPRHLRPAVVLAAQPDPEPEAERPSAASLMHRLFEDAPAA